MLAYGGDRLQGTGYFSYLYAQAFPVGWEALESSKSFRLGNTAANGISANRMTLG
jgi:hypothetical protein